MKKRTIIIALLLIASISAFSMVYEPDKLRVHIRLDKKTYYADEEINLQVCVKNISEKKNYFEVYDSSESDSALYTTFQPIVFDMKGREEKPTVTGFDERNAADLVKGLDKRMIELGPGEMFTHTVNVKDLFELKLNTMYRIQGLFYPDFEENRLIKADNELVFKIIEQKHYSKPSDVDAIDRSISPKEVMLLTLKAEKDRDWSNWKKYVNIEKYINAFPEFVQKYYRANYEEKKEIEKDFIAFATRERDDYLVDYRVIDEMIEKDRAVAYVDVIVDRFGIRKTNRYKCRYTLEQYRNLWLVTDEEATVMKGVKR
ncbi:MAG TPA: hypothetical protein PK307_08110 [Spirochaetota bacterium]|nr:hypothetical protein [Spirochaetota bacterium]HOD14784.1 hypothetical protein [Spirochaetota bacterium]HPG49108.1 hypothetical protein [Spirochaetota bacterium]HPN11159.1 hypothetical protein [Spirochaetota bacterium]HQL82151.1 hypothetical protein [Spirochaetota bacterium]